MFSRCPIRSLIPLLSLCLVLLLCGCARAPREPGTLRIAGAEPSTLDPAKSYDTTSISLVRVLYRGLVDYGAGAEIVPVIAKSWTVTPDGKIYTFQLRDDVRFHYDLNGKSPGRRVVAEDFRYAIERVLDPATASDGLSPFSIIEGAEAFTKAREQDPEYSGHVAGVTVKGKNEISIRLKQPDATFLNWLTLPFSYAVPREWVEKWKNAGAEFSEHPNGTGPFMLDEWAHDKHVHLRRNPEYFVKGLPRCERIQQQIGGADTLRLMQFELGDIDVYNMEETAAPDYMRLTRDSKWQKQISHAPMMDVRYLCMNNEVAPFDNKLVRQAVNHAINKERIVSTLAGRVQAARGVLPPGMPGYNPQLKGYDYDPEKARALLKKSGYKDNPNQPPVLWYATMVWYPAAAQMIQQDLKQIGMTINLKSMTYPELKTAGGTRSTKDKPGVPMSIMGWIQDYPDPANFLDVLFNAKGIKPVSSLNRAFYSNPQVNKLLDEAGVELDRAKRLKMYQRAEQLIMDDAPWVPLVHTERYVATQPWVDGYKLHPMWSSRLEYVAVQK